MSLWNKLKSNVESYLERKLAEQAEKPGVGMRDFTQEFAKDFDEAMRERSEETSMRIAFHERIPEEEREALKKKLTVGTVEGYELPDLWKAQRKVDPSFKVIDFNAAKERLEQEDWKPTQVTRIVDGVLSRITQESEIDADDDEDYIYYAWEATRIDLQITVSGTCITLEQAKKNCDLAADFVGKANGPNQG